VLNIYGLSSCGPYHTDDVDDIARRREMRAGQNSRLDAPREIRSAIDASRVESQTGQSQKAPRTPSLKRSPKTEELVRLVLSHFAFLHRLFGRAARGFSFS
jgi:hypothetical protein